MNWPARSLDEIEGVDWGEPSYPSFVVTNGHKLRKKPLRDFTPEDLRFMLVQQISLAILMPMALDVLEVTPFVGGDMYEGALLNAALRVDPRFWKDHSQLWFRLNVVAAAIESMKTTLEEELLPALAAFQTAQPQAGM